MVVNCEQVWREISNYLDGEVDSELRAAIEEHVRECQHCTAVLQGTRNVIQLYGDERMMEVPLGFSRRLHQRLESDISPSRRSFLSWAVAAAASLLVAGGIEVARSSVFSRPSLRSKHARPSNRVPPDMKVIVADDGKIFHVAGCPFIHDKTRLRTIRAQEAEREGYAPCVRCMKKYLDAIASSGRGPHNSSGRVPHNKELADEKPILG
jgi:Putative zinc-finger